MKKRFVVFQESKAVIHINPDPAKIEDLKRQYVVLENPKIEATCGTHYWKADVANNKIVEMNETEKSVVDLHMKTNIDHVIYATPERKVNVSPIVSLEQNQLSAFMELSTASFHAIHDSQKIFADVISKQKKKQDFRFYLLLAMMAGMIIYQWIGR